MLVSNAFYYDPDRVRVLSGMGRTHIFNQSWYKGVYEQIISEKEVLDFQEMLTEDGCLIIKFFLMISKQEQKKRLEKLEKNNETSWRVTEKDIVNNKNYEKCLKEYDEERT